MKNSKPFDKAHGKKGFLLPLLIIIIAVLVIGVGIYFYSKNKARAPRIVSETTATSTQTTTTQVSDWKTYSNSKYGFQFSYPKDLVNLTEYPKGQDCKQKDSYSVNDVLAASINDGQFTVYVICQPLNDIVISTRQNVSYGGTVEHGDIKKITVAGKTAYQQNFVTPLGYDWIIAEIPLDDAHYVEIGYTFGNSNALRGEIELSESNWNLILSTFKFTTTPATSNVSNSQITGIWQDAPVLGSGWSGYYQFFASGKYNYRASSMQCTSRDLGNSGNWTLREGNIELTQITKTTVVGGNLECGPSGGIVDGTIQTQINPVVINSTLNVSQCTDNVGSPYPCLSFNSQKFYKYSIDPTYGNDSGLQKEPNF